MSSVSGSSMDAVLRRLVLTILGAEKVAHQLDRGVVGRGICLDRDALGADGDERLRSLLEGPGTSDRGDH